VRHLSTRALRASKEPVVHRSGAIAAVLTLVPNKPYSAGIGITWDPISWAHYWIVLLSFFAGSSAAGRIRPRFTNYSPRRFS